MLWDLGARSRIIVRLPILFLSVFERFVDLKCVCSMDFGKSFVDFGGFFGLNFDFFKVNLHRINFCINLYTGNVLVELYALDGRYQN